MSFPSTSVALAPGSVNVVFISTFKGFSPSKYIDGDSLINSQSSSVPSNNSPSTIVYVYFSAVLAIEILVVLSKQLPVEGFLISNSKYPSSFKSDIVKTKVLPSSIKLLLSVSQFLAALTTVSFVTSYAFCLLFFTWSNCPYNNTNC